MGVCITVHNIGEGTDMATLIRVNGRAGAKIYSGDDFSETEAKCAYADETGEEITDVDILKFDQCEASELSRFSVLGKV